MTLIALALSACTAPQPAQPAVERPAGAAPITVEVAPPPPATTPIMATTSDLDWGQTTWFLAVNLNPGETAWLASAPGEGAGPCVPQLGGLCLGLDPSAVLEQSAVANADGIAAFAVTMPASGASEIAFQVAVRRGVGGADSAASPARTFAIGGCTPPGPTGDTGAMPPTGDTGATGGLVGEWIAFHSFRSGGGDVYLMRPDGSELTQVTTGPDREYGVEISPDGTLIAYTNNTTGALHTIGVDGTGDVVVVPDGQQATWSPDGLKLAYSTGNQIWTANADGSGATQLTFNAQSTRDPAWSPDGTRIAYQVFGDIWVMNADGSGQASVTAQADWDAAPQWSPDSTMLAFQSTRGGQSDIWTMDADGTNLNNVTNDGNSNERPAWSRDGLELVYGASVGYQADIWKVGVDGTGKTNLTSWVDADYAPDWH